MKRQVGVVRTCVRCLKKHEHASELFGCHRGPRPGKHLKSCVSRSTRKDLPQNPHKHCNDVQYLWWEAANQTNWAQENVAIHTKSKQREIPNNTTSKLLQPQKSASSLVRLHVSHDKREKKHIRCTCASEPSMDLQTNKWTTMSNGPQIKLKAR